MDEKELDRHQHQIKGHTTSGTHEVSLVVPYSPLPLEILSADSRCSVHLFTAGITTTLTNFIQEVQNKDGPIHLTEEEWLERYTKFIKDHGKKPKKASKR